MSLMDALLRAPMRAVEVRLIAHAAIGGAR
jgi:hypothetical protein